MALKRRKPTALHGITVNGRTVVDFLNKQKDPDVKEEYRKSIAHPSRPTRDKCKTKQEYNTSPGPIKHLSAEDIGMEKLQKYRDKILQQVKTEYEMDKPNRSKIILSLLIGPNWISANDVVHHINAYIKLDKPYVINSAASWFSSIKHSNKPLGQFLLRKQISGRSKYKLLPSMCKYSLEDLYQLTLAQGYMNPHRMFQKDSALLAERNKYRELLFKRIEQSNEEFPHPTQPEETPEGKVTIPSNITLTIKIQIPPIKILFGWDK